MTFIKRFFNAKLVLALLIFLLVSFGTLWQIDKRIRADEWLWVPLGVRLMNAAESGNLLETKVSTRPGVTISWISGLTTKISQSIDHIEVEPVGSNVYVERRGYVINRIVFGMLIALLLLISFLLLDGLLGRRRALLISILISIHPLTLLKGNIVWTDLFLAIFMLLS